MLSKRQEKLSHDWQIFKAKFMLEGYFERVEQDFITLCELECLEALSVYSATYDCGVNAKIDKMIDSYPNVSSEEMLIARAMGKATQEDHIKSIVRRNRDLKDCVLMTPEDWLLQTLISQAKEIGFKTNEDFEQLFQQQTQKGLSEENDNLFIGYLASILCHGQELTPQSLIALIAIANQPYSKIVQNYLENSNNYSGENESN